MLDKLRGIQSERLNGIGIQRLITKDTFGRGHDRSGIGIKQIGGNQRDKQTGGNGTAPGK